jgi:serine/threonine protein kinase
MSQALMPAAGSKAGRYQLAADSPEALAAASFIGRAEDGRLARVVLVPRAGLDADAVQRAASQAKNVAHPNALRLLEVEATEGRFAVAFEHVDGASLQTVVTAAGAAGLSRGVALRVVLDVLEGLGAAHAGGVAHGELGPHLVWVGTDGQARVVGAGVAKVLGKALAPKTPSDRLAYIAPERVKAASSNSAPAADQKCDVFGAAVLAWELLAKQRLFAGRLESAVIQKVLTAPVAPLAASADDLPDEIDEALKKALERDPAKRTATAKELAQALTDAFPNGAATHEEVGKAVSELLKKQLDELHARLAEAGATTPSGELLVPPPRPTIPTLDELWVEESPPDSSPAPVVRMPPKPPPLKPAPKPIAKATDLKVPSKAVEVKIAEPKAAEPKADAKPAEAKAETKGADVAAEEKGSEGAAEAASAEAKPTEEKPSEEKPADAKTEAKPADAKPAEAKPAEAKAAEVKVPDLKGAAKTPAAGIAAVPTVKKPFGSQKKATIVGIAPPSPTARAEVLAKIEAEKAAKAAAATPKPAAAEEKPAEPAAAKAEDHHEAPPASRTPPQGSAPRTEGERTPASSGPSLSERRLAALSGNLKPGDTLGRYELLMPVASGGMATVWAARLQGTAGFQKTVAIKTMLPGMSADADFEEMFLDEARVAARIRHPNVVEIFDLGEEGETLYLVMEWVEGETFGSLQKSAKSHGGLPMPILLRLASQACAGLHAAHELRDDKGQLVDLVHRDISPANILVSRTGFVKIVDFGVAKSKARMYTTRVGGMVKGKTPYLSPEQLAGQPIDRRSDIYSFGAVLYVLATGLHPFRGETEAKTIENIAFRNPVPPRKLEPSLHADLEAIILKALEKDVEKRFQTASEMQRAIDTLSASIGQAVNDDDVAAFVKLCAGEGLEKRSAALREAIAALDAGKQPVQPRGGPESVRADALVMGGIPASAKATSTLTSATSEPAKAAGDKAAADADAKGPIDDIVEVDMGEGKEGADAAASASPRPVPAIPPPPPEGGAEDPLFNAPSLGSDSEPVSPPADTLSAASTEPAAEGEAAPPRRRTPMIVLGSILGVCALIGIIAIARSGGDKQATSPSAPTSVVAATNQDGVRTGQPATPAQPTAQQAAAPSATASATEAPAAAPPSASATAEPVASAEPTQEPATPPSTPTKGSGGARTTPTKPVTSTPTKPVTSTPTKPVTSTPTKPTKPAKPWSPTTL